MSVNESDSSSGTEDQFPFSHTSWDARLWRLRRSIDRCSKCETVRYVAPWIPAYWTSRRYRDNGHCVLCTCKHCLCTQCRAAVRRDGKDFDAPREELDGCYPGFSSACPTCEYYPIANNGQQMYQICENTPRDRWAETKALERARAEQLEHRILWYVCGLPVRSVLLYLEDLASIVMQYYGDLPDDVLDLILPILRLREEIPAYLSLSLDDRKAGRGMGSYG